MEDRVGTELHRIGVKDDLAFSRAFVSFPRPECYRRIKQSPMTIGQIDSQPNHGD